MIFPKWFYSTLILGFAMMGLAQEEESATIAPDRPGAGNGTAVVDIGFIQLETGWDRAESESFGGDITADAFANTLLRTGLYKRLELRFGWSGYQRIENDFLGEEGEVSGIGDISAGVRMQIRDGAEGGPVIAVDVVTSIPAGDNEVSSDSYDPGINLSLDQALGDRFGLNVNLGANWFEESNGLDERMVSSGFYSVSLGFSLGGNFGGYVEYFGEEPLSASGSGSNAFDGGLTWNPANNWQLDVFYGQDADDSANTFMGAGVAVRFPN